LSVVAVLYVFEEGRGRGGREEEERKGWERGRGEDNGERRKERLQERRSKREKLGERRRKRGDKKGKHSYLPRILHV
jgi:hypothetical protein